MAGHMQGDDWRTLGRPPTFSGDEAEWTEWSFIMKSYLAVIHQHGAVLIEAAEDLTLTSDRLEMDEIETRTSSSHREGARRIYYA